MNSASEKDEFAQGLEPARLTWAVLSGRWVDFARSALALPEDEDGRRLRAAVPDIIMLQAVWFALQHLDELDVSQRSVGIDRAEILIEKYGARLRDRFGVRMPDQLQTLLEDAASELAARQGER